jgi:YHS domain-containing protein
MVILSERFALFAGVHLRTPPDRRVYATLAGTPARIWPVGELAAHAHVSHREADAALRRFTAAGIADRLEPDHHRRYRWSAVMGFLTGADGVDAGIDPVCGMPVDDATAHVVEHDGITVRFCSLPCVVLWRSSHRELGR